MNTDLINKMTPFQKDAYDDLERWVQSIRRTYQEYATEKFYFELEKRLNVDDSEVLIEMSKYIFSFRSYYKDIKMGIDWYRIKFGEIPSVLKNLYDELGFELNRLSKARKYLISRSKRLGITGHNNQSTKNLALFFKIKMNIISSTINKNYTIRRASNIIPLNRHEDK